LVLEKLRVIFTPRADFVVFCLPKKIILIIDSNDDMNLYCRVGGDILWFVLTKSGR